MSTWGSWIRRPQSAPDAVGQRQAPVWASFCEHGFVLQLDMSTQTTTHRRRTLRISYPSRSTRAMPCIVCDCNVLMSWLRRIDTKGGKPRLRVGTQHRTHSLTCRMPWRKSARRAGRGSSFALFLGSQVGKRSPLLPAEDVVEPKIEGEDRKERVILQPSHSSTFVPANG